MHIVNGHLDYLESISDSGLLEEGFSGDKHILDYLSKQIIEYDADCLAASDIVNMAILYAENPTALPEELRLYSGYTRTHVGLGVFAAYSVFRLFGDDATDSNPMVEQWYPPFEVRRKLTYTTAIESVTAKIDWGRLEAEIAVAVVKTIASIFSEAESIFVEIGNMEKEQNRYESSIFDDSPDGKINKHIDVLENQWRTIYLSLLPYACKKLIVPT